MKLLHNIITRGGALSFENRKLLVLAEKILVGGLVLRRKGWVDLVENPEQNEKQELGSEAVQHAGNRVVEGVVKAVEGS